MQVVLKVKYQRTPIYQHFLIKIYIICLYVFVYNFQDGNNEDSNQGTSMSIWLRQTVRLKSCQTSGSAVS